MIIEPEQTVTRYVQYIYFTEYFFLILLMESITISGLFEIVVNYLFCRTVNPVLSGH